jgi:hypothetical protein
VRDQVVDLSFDKFTPEKGEGEEGVSLSIEDYLRREF